MLYNNHSLARKVALNLWPLTIGLFGLNSRPMADGILSVKGGKSEKEMMIKSFSAEQTKQIGEKMAVLLQPGDVICLNGDLGAGKTAFSQGVARGLKVDAHVTSPTFTLINEYTGRLPLYHFDVYRLGGPEEMLDLGYEEYFYGQGVCLVEWAELVADVLPAERLDISLTREEEREEVRNIKFTPKGQRYEQLVEELKHLVCPRD